MTRARLAKLEVQAQQQRASLEARNTERVKAALDLMTAADLHRIRDGMDAGQPWAAPWVDVPPGLPEDVQAARRWARDMDSLTRAHVWPLPPAGAAQIFEQEAAKVETADPARLSWLLLSKLAGVIEAEV